MFMNSMNSVTQFTNSQIRSIDIQDNKIMVYENNAWKCIGYTEQYTNDLEKMLVEKDTLATKGEEYKQKLIENGLLVKELTTDEKIDQLLSMVEKQQEKINKLEGENNERNTRKNSSKHVRTGSSEPTPTDNQDDTNIIE